MSDRGFLLAAVDGFTGGWVNRWSIAAVPVLRRTTAVPASQQFARDVFVTTWLGLALCGAMLAVRTTPPWLGRAIAAVALYRAVDLLISFGRAGVFLSFRGDIDISREPQWRIQRLLLATFINFFELILWYSTIYQHAVRAAGLPIDTFTALNASFATMTTLGTGIAPTSWPLAALVVAQWFTSILMLVVVVGLLVSLLSADQTGKVETPGASAATGWMTPLLVTGGLLAAFYSLLGRLFLP